MLSSQSCHCNEDTSPWTLSGLPRNTHTHLSMGSYPPFLQPTSSSPSMYLPSQKFTWIPHVPGCTPWHPLGPGSRTLSGRGSLHLVHFRLLRRTPLRLKPSGSLSQTRMEGAEEVSTPQGRGPGRETWGRVSWADFSHQDVESAPTF